jgi:hypothetical protein
MFPIENERYFFNGPLDRCGGFGDGSSWRGNRGADALSCLCPWPWVFDVVMDVSSSSKPWFVAPPEVDRWLLCSPLFLVCVCSR